MQFTVRRKKTQRQAAIMWKKVSPGDFVIFLFISRHVKLVCHETSLRHWRLAAASRLTETSHIRNELQCHARSKLLRQGTVSTLWADVSKRDVVPTVPFTTRKKSRDHQANPKAGTSAAALPLNEEWSYRSATASCELCSPWTKTSVQA